MIWKMGPSDRVPNTHEVDRPYSVKQQLRRCVVRWRWRDVDDVDVRVTGEAKVVGLFGSAALGFKSVRVSLRMQETLKLFLLGRRPVPLFIAVRSHLVSLCTT